MFLSGMIGSRNGPFTKCSDIHALDLRPRQSQSRQQSLFLVKVLVTQRSLASYTFARDDSRKFECI